MADNYSTPFDDNILIYDRIRHRYILNRDYIINYYGENKFDRENKWLELANQLSDNVYTFIYSFKQGRLNFDQMEYELACNQFYREVLRDVLLWQYEYAMTTGGDLIQLQHGYNPTSEKMNKVEELRNELMISTKGYLRLKSVGLLESTFRKELPNDFYEETYRKEY